MYLGPDLGSEVLFLFDPMQHIEKRVLGKIA